MTTVIHIDADRLFAILGKHGEHWIQGTWGDGKNVCLHGAIRRCQPQPGDAHLIEQVATKQGWGTGWNDADGTRWEDIAVRCRHVDVTDADLAETFGPQWEQIVALVRRAAVLTGKEVNRLAAVWVVAGAAVWVVAGAAAGAAARVAARDAAGGAAWAAAWAAAGAAARVAARDAAGGAAWDAAGAAACAAASRDLIGDRFTQQHYDLLTRPWRTVIGPIHPDDQELT